ncbi:murein hydrolase activator EnvC family protein [Hoyosella altamirensis]|uniref:Murein DD-endopeptidase MepM/ murein hydrolase activator NlpD n=1 Tax=Hoyosella altamirensis TaxID=616997 RepID=A0A839RNP3_9ACTN|nr:M23 family metallopeptidase [Hoyosella altamirensis]MBB3038612.1 murein DD-endopeptidase MepM/ murein hydrolase activator NlpD [Hoyosella altamirensis]
MHPGRRPTLPCLLLVALLTFGGAAGLPHEPANAAPSTTPRHERHEWPIQPAPKVTRDFDRPAHPYGPGHRGVDLAAAPGTTVYASHEGVVAFAGPVAGRGVVSIDHRSGVRTTYEPLQPLVHRGDHVRTGTPIGTLDALHAGCTATACLHWGARLGNDYLDPLLLLSLLKIVLKPVEPEHTALMPSGGLARGRPAVGR